MQMRVDSSLHYMLIFLLAGFYSKTRIIICTASVGFVAQNRIPPLFTSLIVAVMMLSYDKLTVNEVER
jgi:hypothetical protein